MDQRFQNLAKWQHLRRWLVIAAILPVSFIACQRFTVRDTPTDVLFYKTAERENQPGVVEKPYVIMVSLDGFRNDYITKYKPPFLSQMAAEGALAKGLISSYPTLTFPNHISLITGRYSANHGIVGNAFYDEARERAYKMGDSQAVNDPSWYSGEPIWTVAERNGMLSAVCFWVGSEAGIDGLHPTYVRPYQHDLPPKDRVDQVIRWLKLPEATRPHFVALYFHHVDSAGHAYGPDSQQVKDSVMELDSNLAQLKAQVEALGLRNVTYVFVSDHGMEPVRTNEGVVIVNESENSILQNVLKRWTIGETGAVTSMYLHDPALSADQEAAEVEQMAQLLRSQPFADRYQVFKRSEIPADWHYTHPTKTGDIVLAAKVGYYLKFHLYVNGQGPQPSDRQYRGHSTHGWPTDIATMQGLFLANGTAVKSGLQIEPFSNVNVYPFVLKVLDIQASKPNDGDIQVLESILK